MSNWTFEDLQNYTRKRLKDEAPARAKIRAKARSGYNTAVVLAWFKECGLPEPLVEYQFMPERRFRFDFAWIQSPLKCVALECQGALFARIPGGHNRGAQIRREHEKRNLAATYGWLIVYCEPETICTQGIADTIRAALAI